MLNCACSLDDAVLQRPSLTSVLGIPSRVVSSSGACLPVSAPCAATTPKIIAIMKNLSHRRLVRLCLRALLRYNFYYETWSSLERRLFCWSLNVLGNSVLNLITRFPLLLPGIPSPETTFLKSGLYKRILRYHLVNWDFQHSSIQRMNINHVTCQSIE